MTRRSRRNHSAAFKAKVDLAALRETETLAQLFSHSSIANNEPSNVRVRFEDFRRRQDHRQILRFADVAREHHVKTSSAPTRANPSSPAAKRPATAVVDGV